MGLDGNNIIAAVEIAVYVPALVASVFVCIRHGFSRSSGWFYTLTLSLVRIIGAACQLATISSPGNVGLIKASVILSSLGLMPLLLATLGMLSRLVDWINTKSTSPTISIKHFRVIQLLVTIGTILSIVGVTSGGNDPNSPSTESEVAMVFIAVVFAAIVVIFVISMPSRPLVPENERVILPVVGLALPLVAARVLYSLLGVFVHSGAFARFGGPIAVHLCMATLEEFVVVALYLFLGFRLVKLDASEKGEILSRPWDDNQNGRGGRGGGLGLLGRGGRGGRRHHGSSRAGRSYDPEQGQEGYYPVQAQDATHGYSRH